MIADTLQANHITTVVTVIATLLVAALFRFAHNLHNAIDKRDSDEQEDARMLARVAMSLDAMDETKLHELEQLVG